MGEDIARHDRSRDHEQETTPRDVRSDDVFRQMRMVDRFRDCDHVGMTHDSRERDLRGDAACFGESREQVTLSLLGGGPGWGVRPVAPSPLSPSGVRSPLQRAIRHRRYAQRAL